MSNDQRAKLTITYNDFEDTDFDFTCPVSGDFELEVTAADDTWQVDTDYTKEIFSSFNMKVSQGMLHIQTECPQERGITIEVKDANITYKVEASAKLDDKDCIESENVDIEYIGEDEDEDEDGVE